MGTGSSWGCLSTLLFSPGSRPRAELHRAADMRRVLCHLLGGRADRAQAGHDRREPCGGDSLLREERDVQIRDPGENGLGQRVR